VIEKRGSLLQQINSETHGQLDDLLLQHSVCSVCAFEKGEFNKFERKQGRTVCSVCGYEPKENLVVSNAIAFNEDKTPGNNLAFGYGRGGTLQRKGLFCLLAQSNKGTWKCPNCGFESDDMPIRAQQTSLIMERNEHPKIMTLLKYGRANAIQWGYDERKSRRGQVFSNYYGRLLRKIGKYIVNENVRVNLHEIANACLAYCLHKLSGEDKCEEAVEALKLRVQSLKHVWRILEVEA
jgi:hypothetical protein